MRVIWVRYATPSTFAVDVDLERRGYPVIAPANSLRGLASDAAYIRSVLQTICGPIVLVGHSYGGAVITNAAVGVPNVEALVYIAAFAPDKGESLVQLVTMNPGTQIGPATLDVRPYPLPDGGTGTDLYLNKSAFHDAFAGDLPIKVTDQMQATADVLQRGVRLAVRRARVEDDPVVVLGRHARPRHSTGHRAIHGAAGARHRRRSQGVARRNDLAAGSDDATYPRRGGLDSLIRARAWFRMSTACLRREKSERDRVGVDGAYSR